MITPANVKIAAHAPLVYTPKFWNAAKAYSDYQPNLEGAYLEGVEAGKSLGLESADSLIKRGAAHMLMATDMQQDFRDNGRLPVKECDTAILRTCVHLLNGVVSGFIARAVVSSDGHPDRHVSYGKNYQDKDSRRLDLSKHGGFACLTLSDEKKAVFKVYSFNANGPYDIGYYQPRFNGKKVVEYWKHLQKTGQGDIWVFVTHCKLTSDGTNLHPLFEETLAFAEGAIAMQTVIVYKGHIIDTDWFGPFEPCQRDDSHPQGGLQSDILDAFKPFNSIRFAGIARDFCDFYAKQQAMKYFAKTDILPKMQFLTDCTAAIIPNAAHVIKQDVEAKAAGIKFIAHDEPFKAA